MVKKTTNVCDVCRRVITNEKCEICDKDICEMCQLNLGIQLVSGSVMYYIISCRKCAEVLARSPLKKYTDENVNSGIRKAILKLLRNARMLEEIQDKDDKRRDYDFIKGSHVSNVGISRNVLWPSKRSVNPLFKAMKPNTRPIANPFSTKRFRLKPLKGGKQKQNVKTKASQNK